MIIKRIVSILIVLFFTSTMTYANDLSMSCAEPYDLSMKGTQILYNITGMSLLSQAIANSIVKSELKKATGSKKFKVKMQSYSAKDLADGRFKSLNISGSNLNFDGTYVSEFNANTVCGFNYVKVSPKTIKFKENFIMNYAMTVTDADLRKSILSKDYLAFLNSLNLKAYGMNIFELKDVNVKLNNNKFYFTLKMNNQIFNLNVPINLVLSTRMKVENGQIKVSEVAWENVNQKVNLTQVTNLLNLINPLNFTVDVMGNKNSKVAVNSLDINGDKLVLDGTVYIPKNIEQERK